MNSRPKTISTSSIPTILFFKPPIPGQVKTRLVPAVGSDMATQLAQAFFEDMWESLCAQPQLHPLVAVPELPANAYSLTSDKEVWLQGEGDLGEIIERMLRQALQTSECAMALGADAPGLPPKLLEQATKALKTSDAVLGPAEDGGFYLLGLRTCPSALLANLPWSSSTTFEKTLQRLRQFGLRVAILDPWFDVDRPVDLRRLHQLLQTGAVQAPQTKRLLESLPYIPK